MVNRRQMFVSLLVGLTLALPMTASAEWSLKDFFQRLMHRQRPSPEESTLAPLIATPPPISELLTGLKSRFPKKRLAAIEGLAQAKDAGRPVFAALVKASQDSQPEVARRA